MSDELQALVEEIGSDLGFNGSLPAMVTVMDIISKVEDYKAKKIEQELDTEDFFDELHLEITMASNVPMPGPTALRIATKAIARMKEAVNR